MASTVVAAAIRLNWSRLAEQNLSAALEAVELASDPEYRIQNPAHLRALQDAELIDQHGQMHNLVREVLKSTSPGWRKP